MSSRPWKLASFAVVVVCAAGCQQGPKASPVDLATANAAVAIPAAIADLGKRVSTLGGVSLQPLEGAQTAVRQGTRVELQSTNGPRWRLNLTRIGDGTPGEVDLLQALGSSYKSEDGTQVLRPAERVDLGGLKAVRVELLRSIGVDRVFGKVYAVSFRRAGGQGGNYELTYTCLEADREQLEPYFEKSARTIAFAPDFNGPLPPMTAQAAAGPFGGSRFDPMKFVGGGPPGAAPAGKSP